MDSSNYHILKEKDKSKKKNNIITDDNIMLIDSISNQVNIPFDIKQQSNEFSDNILNSPYTKDSMIENLIDFQYSIKVKPLSYVDEKKYYSCTDTAYKVYEQLISKDNVEFGASKTKAWIMANILMFAWYFEDLIGKVNTGRDVEKIVDLALRSPTYFMLKYILLGLIQSIITIVPALINPFFYLTVGHYIIQIIINLIKVAFKINKSGTVKELSAIKPTR